MAEDEKKTLKELRAHYKKAGFLLNASHEAIEKKVRKLLGGERYEEYLDAGDAMRAGEGIELVYACARTVEEANAIMSHQAQVMVAVTARLYSMALPLLREASRVVDLGCYTGSFAAYIAQEHQTLEVVGVDRVPFLNTASAGGLPNLSLAAWDYASDAVSTVDGCDVLLSSFGIDFGGECWGETLGLDPMDLRNSPGYRAFYDKAKGVMGGWGQLAKDGAHLFTVLRLADVESGVAVLDAAHDSGWSVDLECSHKISTGEETFPVMVFERRDSDRLQEDEIISWWIADDLGDEGMKFEGGMALAFYRAMTDRQVMDEAAQTYDDGHTMRVETGRVGSMGYVFKIATAGLVELTLGGRDKFDEWPAG